MTFDTKTWLKSIVLKYDKGQPYLLQYILDDEELNSLTELVDSLSEYRINEAINNYTQQEGNNPS